MTIATDPQSFGAPPNLGVGTFIQILPEYQSVQVYWQATYWLAKFSGQNVKLDRISLKPYDPVIVLAIEGIELIIELSSEQL